MELLISTLCRNPYLFCSLYLSSDFIYQLYECEQAIQGFGLVQQLGYHLSENTKIRLIIFFATKDGEAPYSQQKQDLELTAAQITNCLLQYSGLN